MRWDELFADLEAQAEALARAERASEVDERTRGELGSLGLYDRLRSTVGQRARLRLTGALLLSGSVRRVGPDWLLLDEEPSRDTVVVTTQIMTVRGLSRYSAVPGSAGIVESRLGLRYALRGLARDRAGVRAHLVDGSTVDATIDRVGADFIEVASHAAGETRRSREVHDVVLLPLASLVAVRRAL